MNKRSHAIEPMFREMSVDSHNTKQCDCTHQDCTTDPISNTFTIAISPGHSLNLHRTFRSCTVCCTVCCTACLPRLINLPEPLRRLWNPWVCCGGCNVSCSRYTIEQVCTSCVVPATDFESLTWTRLKNLLHGLSIASAGLRNLTSVISHATVTIVHNF